ncbi:MAG TPA: DUF222 domain-containing protein, partial [Actinophytocola sp.]|uniref:DUF222 domain-containing protein n=1 Tax=Actinophytocola sp. TaxID=1872138 RepID=UPI002DB9510C
MSAVQEYPALRGAELPAALTEIFTRMRRDYAAALDIINDIAQHHTELFTGYASPARYLAELVRITTRKATTLITQAEQIAVAVTPTGHVAPAQLPIVRQAARAGVLDADHLEAIAEAVAAVPEWAGAENRQVVESALTHTARTSDARVV